MPELKISKHSDADKLRKENLHRLIGGLIIALFFSLAGFAQEPVPFYVTGGGTYCEGGAGITVGLSSGTSGKNFL